MKKIIVVSPETHSSLFFIKGKLQDYEGKRVSFDDVMKVLLSHYSHVYQLEKKD